MNIETLIERRKTCEALKTWSGDLVVCDISPSDLHGWLYGYGDLASSSRNSRVLLAKLWLRLHTAPNGLCVGDECYVHDDSENKARLDKCKHIFTGQYLNDKFQIIECGGYRDSLWKYAVPIPPEPKVTHYLVKRIDGNDVGETELDASQVEELENE